MQCFNTVAVLFLAELDNISYAIGLNEQLKRRVDEVGRVSLSAPEMDELGRLKLVHTALAMLCIVGTCASVRLLGRLNFGFFFLWPFFTIWFGAIIEAATSPTRKAKVVCVVVSKCFLGAIGFALVVNVDGF
eukprot:COSAG03_NODE_1067_length_4919_cov_1.767842_2_plen_132_part_00